MVQPSHLVLGQEVLVMEHFFVTVKASTGDNGLYIMITSGSLYVGTWTTSWQWYIDTNRLFRDDGWYHIVVSVDTTISSPESDRVKLYVNGVGNFIRFWFELPITKLRHTYQ